MGKGSAPATPDYRGAAQEQSTASKDIAAANNLANRPNITTPWGSMTWQTSPSGQTDSTGQALQQWSGNVNLTPETQSALDSQQAVANSRSQLAEGFLGRVGDAYAQPFDQSKLYSAPVNPGESYTQAAMRLMQPNMDQRRAALETQLSNQGISDRGSEAYQNAMRNLGDEESRARLQATMAGMDKDFSARQQSIAEQAQLRGMNLNELNALLYGQQVNMPQFPSFASATSGQAPNYMGAMGAGYQADLNATNAQNAASGNLMSGLFGLGGAMLGGPAGFAAGAALGNAVK